MPGWTEVVIRAISMKIEYVQHRDILSNVKGSVIEHCTLPRKNEIPM